MSQLVVQPALDDAMREILERMFFLEATSAPNPAPHDAEAVVEARLTFDGEPPGSLRLRVTAKAARAISADFLGMEVCEVADHQIGEVVCELANMVCGSVLSRVESAVTFRLSAPEIVTNPSSVVDGDTTATIHSVETSTGRFTAILTTPQPGATENAACPAAKKSAY
jgi:CheY-specific phosphatase CheX